MASKHPDPCSICGHDLRAHIRLRKDPKNVFACECGCRIEFKEDE